MMRVTVFHKILVGGGLAFEEDFWSLLGTESDGGGGTHVGTESDGGNHIRDGVR